MKIGIVGNYGNNNQGDEAILEGILIQLTNMFPVTREELLVFTNSPEQTKEKFGVQVRKLYYKKKTAPTTLFATVRKHRSVIRELDLLIIGGGGILMDLYTHSLVLFGMYGKVAHYTKTPYVIFSAGAGPIETVKGKVILRSLVNQAELVTVRDKASVDVLKAIGVNRDISVVADPAFYVQPPKIKKTDGEEKIIHVGVTAVPYYHADYWPTEDKEKYENYVTGMVNNLECLLQESPEIRIHFFATKHPQDTAVSKDIKSRIPSNNRCRVYDVRLDQSDILKKLNEQDIVIGTRLHSLILALVVQKPIIGIAYHHKVNDFMNDIGCQDYLISMDDLHLSQNHFADIYRSMVKNWEMTTTQFGQIAKDMTNSRPDGMKLISEKVSISDHK